MRGGCIVATFLFTRTQHAMPRPRAGMGRTALALACTAVLTLTAPVRAQYAYMNYAYIHANSARALAETLKLQGRMREMQMIMALTGGARRAPASAATQAATGAPTQPGAARAPLTATDFKPAGRRDAPQRLAAQTAQPAHRAEVTRLSREILSAVEATPGFRRHNLAYAMMVFLGASLQVLSGQEFDDARSHALAQWLNDEMAAAGALRSLDAEARTRLYDTLLLHGGLVAGLAAHGAETGDAAQVAQAKAMARDALAIFGLQF